MASRFTYSSGQLEQYFDRVALPRSRRTFSVANLNDDEKLSYLRTLLKHHQVRIPFENLVQHYSWHRVIDVKPLHLFRKVINNPGRGGYCMEANTLFHHVLLSLGFDCYIAAGRVWSPAGQWTGWTHLVNLVMIGGIKYFCDVAFGTAEPTVPIPLRHGEIQSQIVPAESRVVFESLPGYLSDSKLWLYQIRYDSQSEWKQVYCFTEMELLPTDIPEMNYSPWLSRYIHFTQRIVCARFTVSGEQDGDGLPAEGTIEAGDIDGTLSIDHDKLTWRRHGKRVLQLEFKSEEDRIQALKKYWGIELDIEDQEAIVGSVAAIKSS